jgi:hypothetical protein
VTKSPPESSHIRANLEEQDLKTLSMTKQRVLLLGATGETGGSILEGLLEDSDAFVCYSSILTKIP